jgi:hypothetical protein
LFYENNVQLKWTAGRVAFIKGWKEFIKKPKILVHDTIVFTPVDNGFDIRLYREGTSVEVIWGCKKHRLGPWADPCYKRPRCHRR